jgi:hypothetical protein
MIPTPKQLLSEMTSEDKQKMAKDIALMSSILDLLADDRDWIVRLCVANNPSTSGKTLLKLSKDRDLGIREQVALHKNTPESVLLSMHKDPKWQIRSSIASNVNATPKVLVAVYEFEKGGEYESTICKALFKNPSTPRYLKAILLTKYPGISNWW